MPSVKNYLSLVKFSHTIFAMPFAMIGFFLGIKDHEVNYVKINHFYTIDILQKTKLFFANRWWIFLLVVFCMITARSAAMAFNRWLDKNFDAKNPRTAIREIPAGIISANHALRFVIINSIVFVVCTWFINPLCFFLSPIALFVIFFYSYTKRFTPLCHLVLGLGLSLAPIGAYLAVVGHFHWLPVLFSMVVLLWVSGFDIIYALQDVDFDRSENLYSIPSIFGKKKALRISEIFHLISGILVITACILTSFGVSYVIGVCLFCGMLIYQHSIVKPDDLRRVNLAFMTANGIASVVFAAFVIVDLMLK